MSGAGPITLKQLLADLGTSTRLPVSTSLYLAEQISRAIGELHARGRVHGLLSPSQILLAADGTVRVAGPEGAPRPPGAYLAPEIRNGEQPDVLSDIHAIGAMTFELLTGMTLLQAYVRAPMRELTRTPAPSLFNPGVDLSIDELVASAIDRDPASRPHSLGALLTGISDCFSELDLQPSRAELAAVVSERFPSATLVPLQAPPPAPVAAPAVVAAPALPREKSAPPPPPRAARRPLVEEPEEESFEDEDDEEECTGEIAVTARWAPSRKEIGLGAGAVALIVAVLMAVTSGPSKRVQVDDSPVASTVAKPKAVRVQTPVDPPAAVTLQFAKQRSDGPGR